MKEKDAKFCLKCARPLLKKWNKKYNGLHKDFCNDVCKVAHEGGQKRKSVSKPAKNTHGDFFE